MRVLRKADARLVKGASAPRVLCAGIIVLDNIGVPKVPVKTALFVVEKGEPSGNVRPYPCHGCAAYRRGNMLAKRARTDAGLGAVLLYGGAMTISDRNRIYFEAIGLREIRRELVVGSVLYLGADNDPRRAEAREWVSEQERKIQKADATRTAREIWTLIAAIVAAVAGVIGVVWALTH
jgi:hypothetical protein